ncbi:MAG: hypothetical protein ACOYZ6_06195 [Chloroflexota bacterium]
MKKFVLTATLVITLFLVSAVPVSVSADGPGPIQVPTQQPDDTQEAMIGNENSAIVGEIGNPRQLQKPRNTPKGLVKSAGIPVSSAWTTDGNGIKKTVFNPGDSIRWYGTVTNSTGKSQTAYFVWSVTTPCGSSTLWSGNLTAQAGTWVWYLPGTVPSNACRGTYTYKLSVTFSGSTSSSSANYTVRGVSVSSAWTADGNGTTRTSFNPGDAIGWYANIVNDTPTSQTAYFSWLLNGPCGSTTLWSGDLTTSAGAATWYLPGTIPSDACLGTYTFTLEVTFNGSKTSKAVTYTVGAASACNASCQQMLNQSVTLLSGKTVQARNMPGTEPVKALNNGYGKPGQWPFDYKTMPKTPVKSDTSNRHGDLYLAVINQFGVNSNVRYTRTSYTFCNTFAGDVARAMGHAFPQKSSSDPATIGFPALYNWFKDSSSKSGWTKLDVSKPEGLQKLIAHVNAGKMAVAINSGHIAVIRPGQGNVTKLGDLRIAQAGAKNNVNISLSTGFGSTSTPLIFIHE